MWPNSLENADLIIFTEEMEDFIICAVNVLIARL